MKKNWIASYGQQTQVRKFQEGGAMAPPPAGPEGGAPMEDPAAGGAPDVDAMLAEYAQTRDPQQAVAICDTLVEMMAGAGAGAPAGPEGAPAPEGAPMARNGAKLSGPIFKK